MRAVSLRMAHPYPNNTSTARTKEDPDSRVQPKQGLPLYARGRSQFAHALSAQNMRLRKATESEPFNSSCRRMKSAETRSATIFLR